MATLGKIRRMYFRDGLSISEISKRTSLSRNTIKAWLKKPEGAEPKYRRQSQPGKLSPYAEALARALTSDAQRPKRDRRRPRHFWPIFVHRVMRVAIPWSATLSGLGGNRAALQ